MTQEKYSARDAGYTLVELLVVLAVLAILSGLVVTSLHSVAEGWPRLTRSNADNESREATRRMLNHLFSQIYPAKLDDGSGTVIQFNGEHDRIDFLAPLAPRFGTDDIVLYTVRFLDDDLRIAWRLDRAVAAGEENSNPPAVEERISDCRDGTFLYYGRAESGEEIRWWSSWKERKVLPLLIRVRFVRQGRQEELLVSPLITAGACAMSATNAACQD
jgi:prepilin-type N-terminal cleavage/methylation domain-containing protein